MSNSVIELGGRRFKRLEGSTVRHDFWLMSQTRELGLDQVKIASRKREDIEAAMDELIDRVIFSGKACLLLGGLMLPETMNPREWKPEVAEDIALHLEMLQEPADKEMVRPLVASMLSGFFASGLASLQISPESSNVKTADGGEPESANAGD